MPALYRKLSVLRDSELEEGQTHCGPPDGQQASGTRRKEGTAGGKGSCPSSSMEAGAISCCLGGLPQGACRLPPGHQGQRGTPL